MVFAEEISQVSEIDLSTNPGKVLFDLSNVKPGDSVTRDLVLTNNGSEDFNYILSNKFLSGDRVFYNQLDLSIEDSNGKLYEGKLHKFDKFDPRLLKSKEHENLKFHIKIPMELGNEFQGLNSDFQIKIYVEGTLGGLIPVDNRLPSTATDMFNLLAAGAILIGFGILLFLFQRRKKIKAIKS